MSRLVLLGPQRLRPMVDEVARSIGAVGRIALITAGWQENEGADHELHEHLGGRSINLGLYARAERLFQADDELYDAYRTRQGELIKQQEIYSLRLSHAMAAARELVARKGESNAAATGCHGAIKAIRELDRSHLKRLCEIHDRYEAEVRPGERESIQGERRQIARHLQGISAVAIAGGHVAVLLNRLALFDLPGLIGDIPVIAWSAGAMALSEKVVLFHDTPPQGPGNAEIMESGLSMYTGLIPLPHARHRLALHDPDRVSLFARRFSPSRCIPMDEGARVDLVNDRIEPADGTMRLNVKGNLLAVKPT